MKTLTMKLLIILMAALLFAPAAINAGHHDNVPKASNYVVLGAFSQERNAVRFTRQLERQNKQAAYAINPARGLFYVYVLVTEDKEEALELARKFQSESDFNDAWVFSGLLGNIAQEITLDSGDYNPVSESRISVIQAIDNQVNKHEESPAYQVSAMVNEQVAKKEEELPSASLGTRANIKVVSSGKGQNLSGDILIVDADRARKMNTVPSNKTVYLKSPNSKSGKLLLVCEIFGYRKAQVEIDFNDPLSTPGVFYDNDGVLQIPFELIRLRKGDISTLYNVYFFKDAAVMRPESRFEVMSLFEMMEENPNYVIKIHGHTNGNAAGKIIEKGSSPHYFALNDKNKEGIGSAKELSKQRALIIKNFLIESGIDEHRLQVKAWGGKRMIHDKLSVNAQSNIRVEIEIVKD